MPIFRPLASLVWEEEEVTCGHGTSRRFAASFNGTSTFSLALLGGDKNSTAH